ncbi:MAG TPA: hypothetical protein VG538_06150 [Vicinamibacterales bacterium]|jgi:hypothetical protein|nr:hypothetical protein [Vicinamibacterales bacterium]
MTPNGSDYRVKAEHPRRPGQSLRITNRHGSLIAVSGDRCDKVAPDLLASMIANGYVERVEPVPMKRQVTADEKGGD